MEKIKPGITIESFTDLMTKMATEGVEKFGYYMPTVIMLTSTDVKYILIPNWPDNKTETLARIRQFCQDEGVEMLAITSEAWMSTRKTMPDENFRPSLDPNRVEVVHIVVEDISGKSLYAMAEFDRSGEKPKLKEFKINDGTMAEGNMTNLLRPRSVQ